MILFYVIGFGPKILYTTPERFLHTDLFADKFTNLSAPQFNPFDSLTSPLLKSISKIKDDYFTSLLIYFSKSSSNTEFHYTAPNSMLTPLQSLLFIIGIIVVLTQRTQSLGYLALFFVLLIPLSHSALTNQLNISSRLSVASGSLAILAGIGTQSLVSLLHSRPIKIAGLSFALLIFLLPLIQFFKVETATRNRPVEQFLSTHTAYFLQKHTQYFISNEICILVSPAQTQFWHNDHIKHQFLFFTPKLNISINEAPFVAKNEMYLLDGCQPKVNYTSQIIPCRTRTPYLCPNDFDPRFNDADEVGKDIIIYY